METDKEKERGELLGVGNPPDKLQTGEKNTSQTNRRECLCKHQGKHSCKHSHLPSCKHSHGCPSRCFHDRELSNWFERLPIAMLFSLNELNCTNFGAGVHGCLHGHSHDHSYKHSHEHSAERLRGHSLFEHSHEHLHGRSQIKKWTFIKYHVDFLHQRFCFLWPPICLNILKILNSWRASMAGSQICAHFGPSRDKWGEMSNTWGSSRSLSVPGSTYSSTGGLSQAPWVWLKPWSSGLIRLTIQPIKSFDASDRLLTTGQWSAIQCPMLFCCLFELLLMTT